MKFSGGLESRPVLLSLAWCSHKTNPIARVSYGQHDKRRGHRLSGDSPWAVRDYKGVLMLLNAYLCASSIKNVVIKYRVQWGVKVTLSKIGNSAIDVNLALSLFHLCRSLLASRHVTSLDLSARLSHVFRFSCLVIWNLPLKIVIWFPMTNLCNLWRKPHP